MAADDEATAVRRDFTATAHVTADPATHRWKVYLIELDAGGGDGVFLRQCSDSGITRLLDTLRFQINSHLSHIAFLRERKSARELSMCGMHTRCLHSA